MQQGRLERAEADCRKALEATKYPSPLISYICLADVFERKGNRAEALQAYLAAYEAQPGNEYVVKQLATLGVRKPLKKRR